MRTTTRVLLLLAWALSGGIRPAQAADGLDLQLEGFGSLELTDTGGTYSITSITINDARCSLHPWKVVVAPRPGQRFLFGVDGEFIKWFRDGTVTASDSVPATSVLDGSPTLVTTTPMDAVQLRTGDTVESQMVFSAGDEQECGDKIVNLTAELSDGSSLVFDTQPTDDNDDSNDDGQ
jgi:hypothetical protein